MNKYSVIWTGVGVIAMFVAAMGGAFFGFHIEKVETLVLMAIFCAVVGSR